MTEDLSASSATLSPPVFTESTANIINGGDHKSSINEEKKKRKGGGFNFFKAALLMMRGSSKKQKNKQIIQSSEKEELPSKGENWRKIVGSIRPLHVPDNHSPTLSPSTTVDNFEDLLIPQASSNSLPSSFVDERSSVGTMSQYSSATNLQELDENKSDRENDDPNEELDATPGDEMIDAKAEEFIAQFYQQMRLQNIETKF